MVYFFLLIGLPTDHLEGSAVWLGIRTRVLIPNHTADPEDAMLLDQLIT
jgi:hypothetical protein